MNEEKFIDEALKEHARNEGKNDQSFLDQLEAKLDQEPQGSKAIRETGSKDTRARTGLMTAAALVMMGVTAGALYKVTRDKSSPGSSPLAINVSEDRGMPVAQLEEGRNEARRMLPLESPGKTSEGKERAEAESDPTGSPDVISKDTDYIKIPVPVIKKPMDISIHPAVDFDQRFEDHDGKGRGRFAHPIPEVPSGNKYGQLIDQGFLAPLKTPLSTFSIDVDTASYANIRKHVESNRRIDPNGVRIEEMINYFDYQYNEPTGDHPFAVHTEVAGCPWNAEHRLVKIGLKGKEVKEDRKAANLVFLIDVSGSMKSPDKLPLLVQSFQLLLKSLNEEDRVSLVVYAGRQAVLLNPTAIDEDGRRAVDEALGKLSAGGSTNGAAGISTAYDLARKGFIEGGVNRVVLATDGDFNVGTTDHTELLKLVKNQAEGQISLTILGFGQGNLNDNLMEQLTNHGDGNYFYLDSLREGQKVFQHDLTGTIQTIAKDVKIQVEFNPGKVAQYRLIGYANRRLKDEDFANDKVDAGDIGAGHTVTALYEVVPVGIEKPRIPGDLKYQKTEEIDPARKIVDSPEMLTVKLRYKQPDGDVSTELSEALTDQNKSWNQSSDNFRFASSVALWGMLLRGGEYAGQGDADLVNHLAISGKGDDPKGERTEFLDLVRKWSARR